MASFQTWNFCDILYTTKGQKWHVASLQQHEVHQVFLCFWLAVLLEKHTFPVKRYQTMMLIIPCINTELKYAQTPSQRHQGFKQPIQHIRTLSHLKYLTFVCSFQVTWKRKQQWKRCYKMMAIKHDLHLWSSPSFQIQKSLRLQHLMFDLFQFNVIYINIRGTWCFICCKGNVFVCLRVGNPSMSNFFARDFSFVQSTAARTLRAYIKHKNFGIKWVTTK